MDVPPSPWATRGLRAARHVVPQRYVIVHGFYGMGNVGDEAILAATLQSIGRYTSYEPLVFAWDADRVKADFGVRSLDPRVSPRATSRAILQAKAVLLGGGGLIKDYGGDSSSLFRWMHWLDHAHRLGVATMTWSVGVGNVVHPASAQRVREVLGRIDAVTVRDEESARRLRALGLTRDVTVTSDPVVSLARTWRGRHEKSERLRVVVCPRALLTEADEVTQPEQFDRLLDAFAEVLDHVQDVHGAHVTGLALRTRGKDDDRDVCRRIVERMRGGNQVDLVTTEDPTTEEVLTHLCQADLQIGMRLHATILATSLGVPSVAVAYLPKVRGYMASLGQEAFCAAPGEAEGAWMIDRVNAALADRDRLGDILQRQTDQLAEAYSQNGTLLAGLMA